MVQGTIETQGPEVHPDIAEMFKAGVHFGYHKTKRHPNMRQFIFGTKNNVEVFDLSKVYSKLQEALEFVKKLAAEDKTILFVGTKACAKEIIRQAAESLEMPVVHGRWLGGTLTNFKVISDRIAYWQDLERMKATGEIKKYTKQEQLKKTREMEKLNDVFGGLQMMKKLPSALFVIDINEEKIAVDEAHKKKIPVIAVTNTDTDPALAAYPIPANDNSQAALGYIVGKLAEAYKEGKTQAVPADTEKSAQ